MGFIKILAKTYGNYFFVMQSIKVLKNMKKDDNALDVYKRQVYTVREVVDEVFDSRLEISLKDALAINSAYELGDKIKFEEAPAEFGRVAAQSAKQTIMEKMRKQTRAITYNTYKEHEQEIMSGTCLLYTSRCV